MADKKGVILIRFPEYLADKLRRVSFELNIPIKDIVSQIVDENLETWFGCHALRNFNETEELVEKLKEIVGKEYDKKDFVNSIKVITDKLINENEETLLYVKKSSDMLKNRITPLIELLRKDKDIESSGNSKRPRKNTIEPSLTHSQTQKAP